MSSENEFSVWTFFPDDTYTEEVRFVSIEKAGQVAKGVINSVGGKIGTVKKVMITDGGDCVVFEWKYGEGIVWPKQVSN